MKKEPTRSDAEVDVVYNRRHYSYLQRPGVCRGVKRQMNKRFRRREKLRLKKWSECYLTDNQKYPMITQNNLIARITLHVKYHQSGNDRG